MAKSTTILVVDDELPIVEAVCYNLRKEGYETVSAGNAEDCLALVRSKHPSLILLDVMLPSASGFDLCRLIRKQSTVPIIMLTARADETDRIVGLELGADDYVTKPFSMRELMIRVKTVLRRTASSNEDTSNATITAGDLTIEPDKYLVTVAGKKVDLSHKEFELLRFFAMHPGQVFSRPVLLDRVWGADAYVEDRTVDVHVRWLREKIETDPSRPQKLLTVRGVGYKFSE